MDALVELLMTQYKMTQAEAQKYADIIQSSKDREGLDRDNLQRDAYSGAAGEQSDFDTAAAGRAYGQSGSDNIGAPTEAPHASILARMGRLKRNAELFTKIAAAKDAGRALHPEAEKYYNQVLQVHKNAVAQRGREAIGRREYGEQYIQRQRESAGSRGILASEDLYDQVNGIKQGAAANRDPQGYLYRVGDMAGVGGGIPQEFAPGLQAPQNLYNQSNQIAADYMPQSPEAIMDANSYYAPNIEIGDVAVRSLPRRK